MKALHRFTRSATFAFVLLAVVTALGAAPLGVGVAAAQDGADEYAVIQGDECTPIEPIGDGFETAEEFYDYRTPDTDPSAYSYSSHGTTDLQEDDTSFLALHEGSDGLSLVVVHDRYAGDAGGTTGGSATFVFDELPEDGEWAVEDDDYDGHDNEYDHRETSSRMSWIWSANRTDGAMFTGGLDDNFAIEIDPAFNEAADLSEDGSGYDGQITDWQALSGPDHDLERTSLDLQEPIEVRSGGCTIVSGVSVDGSAHAGAATNVEATVTNLNGTEETITVPFEVDGELVAEEEVTVGPGETATVSTTIEFEDDGSHEVSAGTESQTVDVGASGQELPGFGVFVAVGAIVIALIARNRR